MSGSPIAGQSSYSTGKFTNEEAARFVKQNIAATDKSADMLQHALSSYNKHQIELQGKGLKIAAGLELAQERINVYESECIAKISKLLKEKEMLRSQLSLRIHGLSVEPLLAYPILCQKVLQDVKNQKNAISYQRKTRDKAENIMLKEAGDLRGSHSKRLSKSQLDLAEATGNVSATTIGLQDAVSRFEDQKEHDFKAILKEYLWSEMMFHARSLEILTECYSVFNEMNE